MLWDLQFDKVYFKEDYSARLNRVLLERRKREMALRKLQKQGSNIETTDITGLFMFIKRLSGTALVLYHLSKMNTW